MTETRCCPYCQRSVHPSLYRLQQRVCSQPECQRHRRADYHRRKIQTDPVYAQVVQDSRKQWRAEHADYQKTYWRTHPEAAERNRQRQRQLDRQRRVAFPSALPLSLASLKFSSSASISVSNVCPREVGAAPRSQVFSEPISRNAGSCESRSASLPIIHSPAVAWDMPSTWRGRPPVAPAPSPAANRRYTSNERPRLAGRAAPPARLPGSRKCRVSP